MALEAEPAVGKGIAAFFLQQGDGQEFALGFGHFAVIGIQVMDMEPVRAPGMAQEALGLRDFVGMMGKRIVHAAAMEVQIFAVVLHGDTGALDMPAGVSDAPGGIPFQGLVLELALGEPEDEIILVPFVGVFLHALPNAYGQIILFVVVEDIVAVQFGGVEIDVASRKVRVAFLFQRLNYPDIILDHAGSGLHHVGTLDIQFPAVLKKRVGVKLGNLHHGLMLPLCALEHLILSGVGVAGQMPHVGNIHHPVHVEAHKAQVFLQHVLHDIAPEVADMGEMVDRRAAGVHLHAVGGMGPEFFLLMGRGIIKIHNILLGLFFFL